MLVLDMTLQLRTVHSAREVYRITVWKPCKKGQAQYLLNFSDLKFICTSFRKHSFHVCADSLNEF